jgi:uncharacterized protein YcgL (UPF0745 family)
MAKSKQRQSEACKVYHSSSQSQERCFVKKKKKLPQVDVLLEVMRLKHVLKAVPQPVRKAIALWARDEYARLSAMV